MLSDGGCERAANRFASPARAAHGVGKSTVAVWVVMGALSTDGTYGRVVVTANTETQLRTKTWPKIISNRLRLAIHLRWSPDGTRGTLPRT